ncbi:Hypothetical predicted protein [Pelobates cultripes]|uniref:Uncharacterized protein n=1 Tax=Pelobates cultripes TaxID=61616 RepID=A0AAD1WN06_PELCU|nr:Hypothetical predicted protein [Pelobates cultripes]
MPMHKRTIEQTKQMNFVEKTNLLRTSKMAPEGTPKQQTAAALTDLKYQNRCIIRVKERTRSYIEPNNHFGALHDNHTDGTPISRTSKMAPESSKQPRTAVALIE